MTHDDADEAENDRKKKKRKKKITRKNRETDRKRIMFSYWFISGYIDRLKECYKKTYVGEARCLKEI